jgi:hypothetical protein
MLVCGRQPEVREWELFMHEGVIPSMAQIKSKRMKNELRDALLISFAMAAVMLSAAMLANAYL